MKAVAALVLLALAGCGTLEDLGGGRFAKALYGPTPAPHVFGGVRVDVFTAGQSRALGWFHFLDIPFSLPFDLVLLPVSIPIALFWKAPDVEEIPK